MKKSIAALLGVMMFAGAGCAAKPVAVQPAPVTPSAPGAHGVGINVAGHYVYTDSGNPHQFIDVEMQENGKIKVQGHAYWQGADAENIHDGTFGGYAQLQGTHAVYASGKAYKAGDENDRNYDGCIVIMDFVGDVLNAKDNLGCGGVNVTFMGEYKKAPDAKIDWSNFDDELHAYDVN